jgi:hypothetical protein
LAVIAFVFLARGTTRDGLAVVPAAESLIIILRGEDGDAALRIAPGRAIGVFMRAANFAQRPPVALLLTGT